MKLLLAGAAVAGANAMIIPLDMQDANNAARVAFVNGLNLLPGMTWKAGVLPQFAGKPIGEGVRSLAGVHPDNAKNFAHHIKMGHIVPVDYVAESLPESFDSAVEFPECRATISDIRDQSDCGCCWAFGAAEAASDRMCIATKGQYMFPLSAQDVCFCASADGCDGGMLYPAWEYIMTNGVVTGGQKDNTGNFGGGYCSAFSLPHCHHHGPQRDDPYPAEGTPGCQGQHSQQCPTACDAGATGNHTVFAQDKYSFRGQVETYTSADAIATAIMQGGPVEAAFSVYSDFEAYTGGIYEHKAGDFKGGHAIKIVGWGIENGVRYWKVQNSWNKYWGENGYFRIKRGTNECNIEADAVAASASAVWGPM